MVRHDSVEAAVRFVGGDGGVDLTESKREEILAVLADPPLGLEELCRELRKERAAEMAKVEEQRGVAALDALSATG